MGIKPGKINHQLLAPGPVRTEARRLAWLAFAKGYKKGDPGLLSPQQRENAITVMLWNSGDHFLNLAKLHLGLN